MNVVDSTAEEIGTEIVPAAPAPAPPTLFRTDDPVEVIERATAVADALKQIIVSRRLASNIQGREHVRVEGWTTLGSMLGVVPVVVWSRPIENGYEARVEARTLDGRVIGAAEAMCTRDERTWKSRDDYALRSMAQTRATSKALRGPLGFVVTLAGYDATPAEEMPAAQAPVVPATGAPYGAPPIAPMDREQAERDAQATQPKGPSEPQLKYMRSLLRDVGEERFKAEMQIVGVSDVSDLKAAVAGLSRGQASKLIEGLKG